MKRNLRSMLLALAVLLPSAIAAQPSNSQVAVNWTVYPGFSSDPTTGLVTPCTPGSATGCVTTRIQTDSTAPLTDCYILTNDNYNAVCNAPKGTRYIQFDFTNRLAVNQSPSVTQPSWATGTIKGGPLNVKDLVDHLHHGLNDPNEYSFTTRFGNTVATSSSKGTSYTYRAPMRSDNPTPDAAFTDPILFNPNDPFQTALVQVHHCPDTTTWTVPTAWCATGQKETWWVYADSQPTGANPGTTTFLTPLTTSANAHYVIGLAVVNENTQTGTNLGQYSMPFLFKIQIQ